MTTLPSRRVGLSLGALVLLLAGCAGPGGLPRSRGVEPFVPTNVTGEAVMPADVRRVVLLPLHGGDVAPGEMTVELDRAFATALQQQARFEVIALTREECLRRFRAESLSAVDALPRDLFTVLRDVWGADAVLFVDLTAFEPNRPLVLGVRAKLARLDDARLVWALDTVYSAAEPAVAEGARRHAMAGRRGSTPVNLDAGILQSPSRFAAYVATTSFSTLPPR
jgi:hypothetical protein